MAAKINVRIAEVHGIFKEEGEGAADDGRPYDIHITGFDTDGHPTRPVYEVPRTSRVMRAIQEGRLIDVERTEGGLTAAQDDVARLKDWHISTGSTKVAQYGASATSNEDNKKFLQDNGIIAKTQEQQQAEETAAAANAAGQPTAKK